MATFSVTVVVAGGTVPATSATFIPAAGPFSEPVAPGTVVGAVTVTPANWSGVITIDAPFTMQGTSVVVGASPLAAGTYEADGLATP